MVSEGFIHFLLSKSRYFTSNPKKFIELIEDNKDKSMDDLISILDSYANGDKELIFLDVIKDDSCLEVKTRMITASYDSLCVGGWYEY